MEILGIELTEEQYSKVLHMSKLYGEKIWNSLSEEEKRKNILAVI